MVGLAEDEAVPDQAMTVAEVNKKYKVGDRDKHQKAEGKSQAVIEGLHTCFYPIIDALDAPQSSARRVNWIEGERLAFGFFEVSSGHDEPQMQADHELFIYVLSGELQAQSGTAGKLIKAGDIIHAPRGDTYRLQVRSPFARYVMVRSTSYLEHRIESMTPEQAEQARVNVKAN